MMWAQAQITGYHILRESPDWISRLEKLRGTEIYPDSHEVELLGLLYPLNPPSDAQDLVFELGEKLEHIGGGLTDESLRRIIDEMLLSVDANSSYWRFPLGRALRAANYGELDEFFKPAKKKARGQPYTLAYNRALAVSHVYYLQGKGLKKYVALTNVAEAIAVSPETIRDWEKSLKEDDYFRLEWEAAALAGEIEDVKDTISRQELRERYTEWQFASRNNVDMALTFLDWSKGQWSLKSIKEALREAHKKASNK